jgi:hypothetical protein
VLKTAIALVLVAALGGAIGCEALTAPDDPLRDDREIDCRPAVSAEACPAVNR